MVLVLWPCPVPVAPGARCSRRRSTTWPTPRSMALAWPRSADFGCRLPEQGQGPDEGHDDDDDHHRGGPPRPAVHRLEGMPLGPIGSVERDAAGEALRPDGRGAGRRRRRSGSPGRGTRRCPAPGPGGTGPSRLRPGRCRAAGGGRPPCRWPDRSGRRGARSSPVPSGTSAPSSDRCPWGGGAPRPPPPLRRPGRPRSGATHITTIQPEVSGRRVSRSGPPPDSLRWPSPSHAAVDGQGGRR